MSQMDDEKWAALLENSLTRKEEQKVLIKDYYNDFKQNCEDERGGDFSDFQRDRQRREWIHHQEGGSEGL